MPSAVPEYFISVELEEQPHGIELSWRDDRGSVGQANAGDMAPFWAAVEERRRALGNVWRPSGKVASLPIFVRRREGHGIALLGRSCPPAMLSVLSFVSALTGPPATSHVAREPIELPLRVLAVGHDARFWSGWHEYEGLALETCEPARLKSHLSEQVAHIIVAIDDRSVEAVLQLDWGELDHPPRLIVGNTPDPITPLHWSTELALGWSLEMALIRMHPDPTIVRHFLLDIIHDDPLHEAVRGASQAQLFATPESNHNLRLSKTAERLTDRVIDALIRAPFRNTPPVEVGPVPEAVPFAEPAPDLDEVARILDMPLQFDRESNGLAPIHRASRIVRALERTLEAGAGGVRGTTRDATPAGEPLPRFVDIRLQRLEHSPFLHDRVPSRSFWVERGTALRAGARYLLRIQLGARSTGSLVIGDVPSIDGTLSEPSDEQPRRLEVAVFDQGMAIEGESSRFLSLPLTGPTDAIRFTLRPDRLGTVGARISIYWQKVLLQSFQLTATASTEERTLTAGESPLEVSLDFSRTTGFHHVDENRQPTIALGVNSDVSGGTHSIFVKAAGSPAAFRLPENDLAAAMQEFRKVLAAATEQRPGVQRYPLGLRDPDRCRTDLWNLARVGWDLWAKLRIEHTELWDALERVRTQADSHVQIARLNAGFAFPWSTLYDWELPTETPTRLCLGSDASGAACGHGWDTAARDELCVRGFWGIRHRLEQLVGQGTAVERLHAGPVLIAADDAKVGVNRVLDACPPGGASIIAPDTPELLAPLFDPGMPPAVYVAIGDHITQEAGGGIPLPHIRVDARVISKTDLIRRSTRNPRWKSERPLIFLMSCNSALPATLVADWVQPLIAKGAAAVIATEALVYPELALEATCTLLGLLYGKGGSTGGPSPAIFDLGEAMRQLHVSLLRQDVPLAFVFTALGDASLRLS